MMKAVFAGLVLAAMAHMTQAQAASNATMATPTPSSTNGTACTALTDDCKRQANDIVANITSLLPNIFKKGIKNQIKALCSAAAGKAKCWEDAARSPVCKNIPNVVKRFDGITIPTTCGGLCNLPNLALALTALLTTMLVEKLQIF
ncbi:uncharacterized protein LOC118424093 [Branchiostoma floridae]|uniref:Uncharacterized protein LOC118424093 n=1 Tax=Branchiostoma floridae TaxID=7739 RepID=A0A9J7LUE5_BRAFL|nr:uncharacterized protein LOC118424093 [Branchiostoma floridae]